MHLMAKYKTTVPGFKNCNSQTNLCPLGIPGTDHNQMLYHMRCDLCASEYAANGSDIHLRKCPSCQGGAPSSGGWHHDVNG